MKLNGVNIERTRRVEKTKQNKKEPRPIISKFLRCNCRRRIFFFLKKKKKLKNTGISITERLTVKCLEMLNKANERFCFRNASMLDGKIYYLAEGCLKPQIFRNWAKVAGFEIWKKSVAWVVVFFVFLIFIVIHFWQVSLLFCSHINGIALATFWFDLLFSFPKRIILYDFLLKQQLQ